MRISSIYNYPYTQNFTSCARVYNNKESKITRYNVFTTTQLFRKDLNWIALMNYMQNHFKDKENVNLYSLACSDGSEAYTLAISVLEYIPKKHHEKFLPIIASDIDFEVVKAAKSGFVNLAPFDTDIMFKLNGNYFDNTYDLLDIKGDTYSNFDVSTFKVNDRLKDLVKFQNKDIVSQFLNIKDDANSVILCRNVFPYLSQEYMKNVLDLAVTKLKPGSLFIIGDYDRTIGIELELERRGFKEIMKNVYEKV